MTAHRDLTGADLHEPKGIELAQTSTVYVSDGLGTGGWKLIGTEEIDTEQVKNVNRYKVVYRMDNIENASVHYLPITDDSILLRVTGVISGPLTGAPSNVELKNSGLLSMGIFNADYLDSTAGTMFTMFPTQNASFPDTSFLSLHCDGNGTGTNVSLTLVFDFAYG